jgi:hypothetical protein
VVELGSFITSGIGIESVKLKNLRNRALPLLSLDMDHEINQIADLTLDGLIGKINIRA